MHLYGCDCAWTGKTLRQRGSCLHFLQGAGRINKCRDRRLDLIHHVKEPPIRVKDKLARPRSGMERGKRRIVRGQLSPLHVEVINENPVEAEIGHENKAVVG